MNFSLENGDKKNGKFAKNVRIGADIATIGILAANFFLIISTYKGADVIRDQANAIRRINLELQRVKKKEELSRLTKIEPSSCEYTDKGIHLTFYIKNDSKYNLIPNEAFIFEKISSLDKRRDYDISFYNHLTYRETEEKKIKNFGMTGIDFLCEPRDDEGGDYSAFLNRLKSKIKANKVEEFISLLSVKITVLSKGKGIEIPIVLTYKGNFVSSLNF